MKLVIDTNNREDVANALLILGVLSGTEAKDAHNQTETVPEATEKEKTTPSKGEVEKTPEESESKPAPKKKAPAKKVEKPAEETTESSITLDVLKEAAKNGVSRASREEVKKTIGEFADKLASVSESDYGKLYKKLQELGK